MTEVRRFEPGSLENPHHRIESTKLWRRTFEKQSELEKRPEGLTWQNAFREMLEETLRYAAEHGWPADSVELPSDINERVDSFFHRFKDIEMADTVFHDIPEAAEKLVDVVQEIDIWTKGDVGNEYQVAKVQRSGVYEVLEEAKTKSGSTTELRLVVDDDKISRVQDILQQFWEAHDRPNVIHLSLYDDGLENFPKSDEMIRQWSGTTGVTVEPLYIRAKSGHQATKNVPKNFPVPLVEVEKLSDAVTAIEETADRLGIPQTHRLTLLDFDGALSDNRVMRLRQGHVVCSHVMKTLKELAQANVKWKDADDREAKRKEIQTLYKSIESLWRSSGTGS